MVKLQIQLLWELFYVSLIQILELYVKPLQFVMEQELLQMPLMLDVLDCKGMCSFVMQ